MAIQTKTIKQQMNSIGNIKKITKTMEMVSVAKMKKAVAKTMNSREYAKYALEIIKTIVEERSVENPLLQNGSGQKTLMIIIASNKGLCGSYNMNVSKIVHKYKVKHSEEIEVISIGKQADKIANRNHFKIIASLHEFGEDISVEDVWSLRKMIIDKFQNSGEYKNVVIAYTEFIKSLQYNAVAREILPVSIKTTKNILDDIEEGREKYEPESIAAPLYTFEPSESRVLSKVIPGLITDLLLLTMLESLASEHSSRMVAMKNATNNATELLAELLLTYNRARQANITQDVSEIIAGAEALNTE